MLAPRHATSTIQSPAPPAGSRRRPRRGAPTCARDLQVSGDLAQLAARSHLAWHARAHRVRSSTPTPTGSMNPAFRLHQSPGRQSLHQCRNGSWRGSPHDCHPAATSPCPIRAVRSRRNSDVPARSGPMPRIVSALSAMHRRTQSLGVCRTSRSRMASLSTVNGSSLLVCDFVAQPIDLGSLDEFRVMSDQSPSSSR